MDAKMKTLVLFLFCGLANAGLMGQEVLLSDEGWPQRFRSGEGSARLVDSGQSDASLKTVAATAPFPFLDDFSGQSPLPDSNFWAVDSTDYLLPTISNRRAKHALTQGVLTFDGATSLRKKHADDLLSGLADRLVSKDFNLSGFEVGDSLYLSFYYQAGGWGDAPESADSLLVSFDTTGSGGYEQVLAISGADAPTETFALVMIPLDKASYFKDGFKFKVENFGSLNGELDVWHVDYVYLAAGRTRGDTNFSDLSPASLTGSLFGDYTAIPRDHFAQAAVNSGLEVGVGSTGSSAFSGNVMAEISDPVGGNLLSGLTSQTVGTGAVQPYAQSIVSIPVFGDQGGNMLQFGGIQVEARVDIAGDVRAENNSISRSFAVDSVYAYDDGQPDAGYGLTYARSFCQEFQIPRPDTLTGVWIGFFPTLHYNSVINQSTCLDGASFNLALWNTLDPDLAAVQQGTGMVINYDTADFYFQRFSFINPQPVETTFWLGIRQTDNKPLGVGFDKHAVSGKVYYESGDGSFTPTSLDGALMIRPEFGGQTTPSVAVAEADLATSHLELFPHPVTDGRFQVRLGEDLLRDARFRLYDLQGRLIWETFERQVAYIFSLEIQGDLESGIYLLEVEAKNGKGATIVQRRPVSFLTTF